METAHGPVESQEAYKLREKEHSDAQSKAVESVINDAEEIAKALKMGKPVVIELPELALRSSFDNRKYEIEQAILKSVAVLIGDEKASECSLSQTISVPTKSIVKRYVLELVLKQPDKKEAS